MALRLSTGLRTAMLSQNLVTNGKFTSATTGWTLSNATLASIAGGQEGNCLEVTEGAGAAPGYAYQSVATRVGGIYQCQVYFKKGAGATGTIKVGTAAGGAQYGTNAGITDAAWTKYLYIFVATTTTTFISVYANEEAGVEMYDEIRLCPIGSLKDIFNGGLLKIYTGTQPTEADDVIAGSLLVTISLAGTGAGITFDDAAAGVIAKAVGETWNGVCGATGTAGWFRLTAPGDLTTDNTTDCRIDGAVATSGSQLNMTSTSFTNGATETISTFSITLPAA
jgi:hypothetical protein